MLFFTRMQSALVVTVATLLLAGCAGEEPGPQFANNPAPTSAGSTTAESHSLPTVAAATPVPLATPVPAAIPSSIGELLSPRGAVQRVFVASEEAIWTIASSGEASRVFAVPRNASLLAIDPSPSGNEVAALISARSGSKSTHELLILDAKGAVTERIPLPAQPVATPVAAAEQATDLIDWSPQGDRVLVALRDGSLLEINLADGAQATPLSIDAAAEAILHPVWSPTGETIAFIATRNAGRERSLMTYSIRSKTARAVVDAQPGRFVVDFAWMPDGVTLLFTEGGGAAGATTGIDLWSISADGANRKLVASAGAVAPVARIANVRSSPDGRSVAYSVFVPGSERPVLDSVWVRDLVSGLGFRIALPTVRTVEDIWWTDRGLVVAVTTDRGRSTVLALLLVGEQGKVSALWAMPLEAATPVPVPRGTPTAVAER